MSETSPPPAPVKDSSPTPVLPARRTSQTSSVRQQAATSPVQNTARNSVDSKHGDVHSCLQLQMFCENFVFDVLRGFIISEPALHTNCSCLPVVSLRMCEQHCTYALYVQLNNYF